MLVVLDEAPKEIHAFKEYPVDDVRLGLRQLGAFGILPLVSALYAFAPPGLTAGLAVWVGLWWGLTYALPSNTEVTYKVTIDPRQAKVVWDDPVVAFDAATKGRYR